MNKKTNLIVVWVCGAMLLGTKLSASAAEGEYHLLKSIPIRGDGVWTAMAVDETEQRLYAAHGNRIEVINLTKDSPVGAITDVSDVLDVVVIPQFHIGYATSGKKEEACLLDLTNLRTTAKMKTGKAPAKIVYEPSRMEIYSLNQGENSATAGEADDGDYEATLDLGGKPTCAVADDKAKADSKKGRVLVGLEDKNEIVVVSAETRKLVGHWPLGPEEKPAGMTFDAANSRLFIACANKMLVLMNGTNGNVMATAPIGAGAANLVYDATTQTVFCATTDGVVTIVHADTPEKLTVVQTLKTKPKASVLGIDCKTHKIYVGSADFAGVGGNPLPNSLKILVYGM